MEVSKKDLIFIYDVRLHKRINCAGIEYLTCAVSLADRKFWLYPRNPVVENIVKEFNQ